MEGPTPVSALIHAATMVNAGVYMVARSYPLFIQSHTAMTVVMIVGIFTSIFAAYIAITQNDIKKVIAYSTISSLGLMFVALGAGAWVAGIFYLFAHGFFKGLMFLCSGSVIHAMGGEQDMRKMGGLRKKIPITFWTMLIGALSMVGIIPFAGFWAKDEILGATFVKGYYVVWARRAAHRAAHRHLRVPPHLPDVLRREPRRRRGAGAHPREPAGHDRAARASSPSPRRCSACVVGVPPETGWLHGFLEPVFFDLEHEAFAWAGEGGLLMLVSLVAGARSASPSPGGCTCARPTCPAASPSACRGRTGRASTRSTWTRSTPSCPIGATLSFASWLWTFVDAKVIDGAVNGVAWLWGWAGDRLRPIQTGRVQNYAMYVFGGMVVLVVVLAWVWGS